MPKQLQTHHLKSKVDGTKQINWYKNDGSLNLSIANANRNAGKWCDITLDPTELQSLISELLQVSTDLSVRNEPHKGDIDK